MLLAGGLSAQPVRLATCDRSQSSTLAESGRRLLAQKRYELAAADFKGALNACPERRALLLGLAQALLGQRKFNEAARAASDFLSTSPDSEPGLLVLADVHFLAQQFAECQKVTGRILAINPKNRAALKLRANAFYLAGHEREAEETFLAAIALDPQDEDAIYDLGRIYYQQNRFEAAIARFKRVFELDPKSYKAYDNLGLCYEALNQDEEAIRYYLKALDLVYKDHRDYDWPYANLANLLLKRGESEKAFDLAEEAAERNPYSARNYYLSGKALARLNKLDLSVKWLERSTKLDPSYPEPHYLLGQVYTKLGRKDDAQREFAAFQEINAKTPRVRR